MKQFVIALAFLFTLSNSLSARQVENVQQAEVESIQVVQLVQDSLSWNGNALPDYPEGTPEITILRITIPAGVQLDIHKHPVINAGVLIKGQLTVVSEENDVLQLKAGDPIIEIVDRWHYGINEGVEPAEIIVFYAGTKDTPVSIIQDEGLE